MRFAWRRQTLVITVAVLVLLAAGTAAVALVATSSATIGPADDIPAISTQRPAPETDGARTADGIDSSDSSGSANDTSSPSSATSETHAPQRTEDSQNGGTPDADAGDAQRETVRNREVVAPPVRDTDDTGGGPAGPGSGAGAGSGPDSESGPNDEANDAPGAGAGSNVEPQRASGSNGDGDAGPASQDAPGTGR